MRADRIHLPQRTCAIALPARRTGSAWTVRLLLVVCLSPAAARCSAQQLNPVLSPASENSVIPTSIDAVEQQAAAELAAAQQPATEPTQPDSPSSSEASGGEAEQESDSDDGDASKENLTRPKNPGFKADPSEIEVVPDEDGRLQFSFRGQKWPVVLHWLAGVSNRSLDWQDMPGDYLNLTTHRRYSVSETYDLLNRHLLARGFTMITQGEVIQVFQVANLDPSLIPRVSPDDLEDHRPHDFVKVSFVLPNDLQAAKAAEDVKLLLSPHHKIRPLLATNRLLVIDAVTNLRDARDMLYDEQIAILSHVVPRSFKLHHARAENVVAVLQQLIGVGASAQPTTPQEMQMEAQRLQMQAQMQMEQQQRQQQQQQQPGGPSAMPKPGAASIYIVADNRTNTIYANAPKEQMALIERTIKMLDAPSDGALQGPATAGARNLKRYSLVTIGPDALVLALREIGNLDPLTQLRTDTDSRTLFAYASTSDHNTIRELIDKLDGSGRQFEVIPLRKHPADQVAGTIHGLMVGKQEKKTQRRRYYYWDDWGSNREKDEPNKGFRVDADVEQNRLLLWATPDEIAEVRRFLAKMGETPDDQPDNRTVRVLPQRSAAETRRLLDQIRRQWERSGGRPLVIEGLEHLDSSDSSESSDAAEPSSAPPTEENPTTAIPRDRRGPGRANADGFTRWAQLTRPAREGRAADSNKPPADAPVGPPLRVTVTPDGRIVLQSPDPGLLNRMEELAEALAPPSKDYEIFTLFNARAYWVKWNLTDYFASELKDDDNDDDNYWRGYYGFSPSTRSDDSATTRLSRKRKLTFISDRDTNTILVRNASPEQLETIRQLIRLYDQEVEINEQNARHTRVFAIQHSRAKVISAAIKEVYRDLLSSKDKEFESGEQGRQSGESRTYITNFGGSSGGGKRPTETPVSFKGLLSIGVDETSNTLLVSAPPALMDNVGKMIEALDERAKPNTTVRVHKVNHLVDTKTLKELLESAVSQPWTGGKRPASPQQQVPQANSQNQQPPQQPGQQATPGQSSNTAAAPSS